MKRKLRVDFSMDNAKLFRIKALGPHAEDPVTSKKAGVYLHILASKSCPGRFWLYIGQSVCLAQESKAKRPTVPSTSDLTPRGHSPDE